MCGKMFLQYLTIDHCYLQVKFFITVELRDAIMVLWYFVVLKRRGTLCFPRFKRIHSVVQRITILGIMVL